MKFKSLHTYPIANLSYAATIQGDKYDIQFNEQFQAFIIDKRIMIPMSRVHEAVIEQETVIAPKEKSKK